MRMPLAPIGLALAVFLTVDCGRPTGIPDPAPGNTQKLPFDRQPSSNGSSPTDVLVPSVARVPEGTAITVRLAKRLSSADMRQGDGFAAKLDDPVIVDGQTLIRSGASVEGRVLEARPASGPHVAGYLRVALVSVNDNGNTIPIETSSVFAKGSDHPPISLSPAAQAAFLSDGVIPADRRLTFRLTQAIDL
jgi:hypothetical protein